MLLFTSSSDGELLGKSVVFEASEASGRTNQAPSDSLSWVGIFTSTVLCTVDCRYMNVRSGSKWTYLVSRIFGESQNLRKEEDE